MSTYRDNPSHAFSGSVDRSLPKNDLHRQIVSVVKEIMSNETASSCNGSWSNVCVDDERSFRVSELTGGITNILYLLESLDHTDTSNCPANKVIVRVYGAGTEDFINRNIENIVFAKLSALGFGPIFHGLFANGRVEGYLNARALQSEEMKNHDIYPSIAETVAKLHQFEIPEIHGTFPSRLSELSGSPEHSGWLWEKIHTFLDLAEAHGYKMSTAEFGSTATVNNVPLLVRRLSEMRYELQWLERFIMQRKSEADSGLTVSHEISPERMKGHRFAMEEVLCHNDLLSGNILLSLKDSGSKIYLIDYEYASYNFRSYDLANHLCEHCGFAYDVRNNFPSQQFIRSFVDAYVVNSISGSDPTAEFIEGIQDVVHWFFMASHLFWGSWSAVQSCHSGIDFDYAGYAQLRYDAYFFHKEKFVGPNI